MKPASRILVFRLGQLGDTLVSVPALHVLRQNFPDAHITLLFDAHAGNPYVHARAVLEGSTLIDDFIAYPAGQRLAQLALALQLRRLRFDRVVYLAPSLRTEPQRRRDAAFFRLAGIRTQLGFDGFEAPAPRDADGRLATMPFEADLLLQRLARDDIPIPHPGAGNARLHVNASTRAQAETWMQQQDLPSNRPLLAVAAGSKMPAKVWPHERYVTVLRALIERHQVWPIFLGGPEDQGLSQSIGDACDAGSIAAGALSIPEGIHVLSRCQAFLGNDSGVMHMAVAAGIRCVALFSARENPGNWYPYGNGHAVLRKHVDCEGCFLIDCIHEQKKCLYGIGEDEVIAACEQVLAGTAS